MVTSEQLESSKAIQQRTGRTFHVATRALPERVRYPTYVLYAFFRIADDVVDFDRIYLPRESLATHEPDDAAVEDLAFSPSFAAVMDDELARTERLYHEGIDGIRYLPEDWNPDGDATTAGDGSIPGVGSVTTVVGSGVDTVQSTARGVAEVVRSTFGTVRRWSWR